MDLDTKDSHMTKRGISVRKEDSNRITRLLDLPIELQVEIILFVRDLATIQHLRLTCSHFKNLCDTKKKVITTTLLNHITTTVLDYYQLLGSLHISSRCILVLPSGGWSIGRALIDIGERKSNFTMMVIKHLPYIEEDGNACHNNIDIRCNVINRSNPYFEHDSSDFHFFQTTSHNEVTNFGDMIVLASGWNRNDMHILLDTRTANVWEYTNGIRSEQIPIEQYFNRRKRDLIECRKVFVVGNSNSPFSIPDSAAYDEEQHQSIDEPSFDGRPFGTSKHIEWVRHLYFKHGWPAKEWNQEQCLNEVRTFYERWSNNILQALRQDMGEDIRRQNANLIACRFPTSSSHGQEDETHLIKINTARLDRIR